AVRLADGRARAAELPHLFRDNHEPEGDLDVLFLGPASDGLCEQIYRIENALVGIGVLDFRIEYGGIDLQPYPRSGLPRRAKYRLESRKHDGACDLRIGVNGSREPRGP